MKLSPFLQKLAAGEVLVADGATGTNLQARGLAAGTPSEQWVLDRPEEIVRLHSQFVAAGANVILTSTFGASPIRLEENKLGGRGAEINQRAVALARQAISGADVLVGGSLGPLGKLLKPYGPLTVEEASAAYREQARQLSEAGADLLVIETQFDIAEAGAAIQSARAVSALPIVCSFSYDRGVRTMMGVKPAQMAEKLSSLGADVLGINCGRSLEDNLAALKELRLATDKPIWFKPNAGMPMLDADGQAQYSISPEEMGQHVAGWLAAGASIVGGCCGTSPEHLQAIALAAKNDH